MFHKLQGVFPMEDFVLGCKFRNGAIKLYDIKPLIREISAFAYFTEHPEAFKQVSISPGGYGIIWNDELDLSAEEVWVNGWPEWDEDKLVTVEIQVDAELYRLVAERLMAEAEDETTMELPATEYSEKITEVAVFLLSLLNEREKLSAAIHKTKAGLDLPAGFDGEVGLNSKRQEIAHLFRRMAGLRSSETLIANGGTGYRFNNEGNQVSYRCDVKRVVTMNFDRNKIRKMGGDLGKKADEVSGTLDAVLVNAQVDYIAPFDVNDTFAEAFKSFLEAQASA